MTDIFPVKANWGQMLDDLKAAGISIYSVAKALGRHWDTVDGWRQSEPRHCDGEALKAIHAKYCRRIEI